MLDGIRKTIDYFSNELNMIREEEARQRVYTLPDDDSGKLSAGERSEL